MKIKIIRCILFLSIISYPIISWGYDFCTVAPSGQTLYYNITGAHVTVTYENPSYPRYSVFPTGDLVIPSTVIYNGMTYTVTSIGSNAFYNCTGLTSITIPNTVTSIGHSAFYGCHGLVQVNFNATNCQSMGSEYYPVFYACNRLTRIVIGETVTNIPPYAFAGCSNLSSISIGSSVSNIGRAAFSGSVDTLYYNARNLTTSSFWSDWSDDYNSYGFRQLAILSMLVIGDSVQSIPAGAFYNQNHFTNVTIGSSVTSIGNSAFEGCSRLTNIVIPNSVTVIGSHAFNNCSSLTNATIGDSVTTIGNAAFYGCSGLMSIAVGNAIVSIGNEAFRFCSGLSEVTIGNSVESIGQLSFYGCSSLTSVTIPNSVTSIGSNAFYDCTGLTSVTIPNSVTSIGYSAFYGCCSLVQVNFNATNCQSMGSEYYPVFYACNRLTRIVIGESVTNIPPYAFSGCSGLSSIILHSEIPPTLSNQSFPSFITSIPITIPCGSYSNYQSSVWWSNFSNVQEQQPWNLNVTSNDSMWGEVIIRQYPDCSNNNECILQASPKTHFHFINWNDGNTNSNRIITLIQDTQLVANFAIDTVLIIANANDSNIGLVSGSGSFSFGQRVNLEAIPTAGYHFLKWTDGDIQNPLVFNAEADLILDAIFVYDTSLIIASSSDSSMGSVTGGGYWGYRTRISLTATARNGYHFVRWNDGEFDNPRLLGVQQDSNLVALFAPDEFEILAYACDSVMGGVYGNGIYPYLGEVTIHAFPHYGYHFTQWSDGNTDNPRTVLVDSNKTYVAQFGYNQYTISGVSSDTIMGLVSGTATQNYLSTASLAATPNYGYHFSQWNDGSTDNPRSIQVLWDSMLTAFFDYNQYLVMVNSSDSVMGVANGTGIFNYLDQRVVSSEAMPGYHFVRWSDGVTVNPRNFTLTRDTSFTAIFEPDVYQLHTSVSDPSLGMVSAGGDMIYMTQYSLVATPFEHCYFVRWQDGNTSNPRLVTIVSDTSFSAIFEREPSYLVVVNSNDLNRGSVSGSGTFYIGEKDTMYAEAYEHYYFSHWSDGNTNNPRVVTVLGDATYTAVFEGEIVDVATSVNNTLMGSVSGGGEYHYGDIVTLVANPKEGYHFMQWSDGSTANPYMFTAYEAMSIEAQFGSNEGIDGVEWDYSLNSRGNEIIIYGVSGRKVQVYDISGRRIAYIDRSNDTEFIAVPARGVYMVKVGDTPARKVVVM